jgi:hypothetical protein
MKYDKWVRMKSVGRLVRANLIKIEHLSDDGEFIRYKVLPNGPVVGQWLPHGDRQLVVDCETVHANFINAYPQLFEDADAPDVELPPGAKNAE